MTTTPGGGTPRPNEPADIPVTRAELEAEANRIVDRDGMPDDTTALAELVIGYFADLDTLPQPIGIPASTLRGIVDANARILAAEGGSRAFCPIQTVYGPDEVYDCTLARDHEPPCVFGPAHPADDTPAGRGAADGGDRA